MPCLSEAEDLICQLTDWPDLLVADGLDCLLHRADHRWRTADQDLNVVFWSWEVGLYVKSAKSKIVRCGFDMAYLDHVRCHEPSTTIPLLRWIVQDVVHSKIWILFG